MFVHAVRTSAGRLLLKLCVLIAILIVLQPAVARAEERPPNIVFFLIDDLGWTDLGCMGSDYYETPNIDRLAAGGLLFSNAYANAPNCAPSRACLLTGQYTPRHGIFTVNSSERGRARDRRLIPTPNRTTLESSATTVAEVLTDAGYNCAALGKWHLGAGEETGPLGQGFGLNVGGNHAGHPSTYFSPYRNPNLKDGREAEYLTDRLTEEACEFIGANRDEPFFLYLAHYAVHTPIQAKTALTKRYEEKPATGGHKNATYAAMIQSVDESVGRVVALLDELRLADDTIVIFFSDNGGHGKITSNSPLRGAKGMLYEGGLRVPLLVRWPGTVAPKRRSDVPVIGTDFFPTLLDIAGIAPAETLKLDGVSLLPLLRDEDAGAALADRPLFWHFPGYLEGKDYPGARDRIFRTRPGGVIRRGDWKLIEHFEDGALELFNLKNDLGETHNLAGEKPEIAKDLMAEMRSWREEVGATVPTTRNPAFKEAPTD